MSDNGYTIVIGLCVLISGGIGFEFEKIPLWAKRTIYVLACMVAIWATVSKEDLNRQESRKDKEEAKKESDRLRQEDRIYFERQDAKKEEKADSRIKEYIMEVNKLLAGRNIKLENLPPINSVKILPSDAGVIVSYFVSQKVGSLKLISVLKTLDPTFDDSFGERLIAKLPVKLGYNSVKITSNEVPDIQNLKFRIKGESPYLTTPIFEIGTTVDGASITTDNAVITVDRD